MANDSAQLWTDLHLPHRLDTVPVNGLEMLAVRRHHDRKENPLSPKYFTIVSEKATESALESRRHVKRWLCSSASIPAGLSVRGVVRAFVSGCVSLPVSADTFPP